MATLVLSTVGTALGGPLGGALGSLVGQSIDQSLFGPSIRKGPRLGDLSVQTSSYGSPVPRIYGTMRVAGTVIWSTDIREDESVEGGGKGSPEYVAYRYSASFAVALSSRPIRDVRRIWADGKLIRGAAGDFKVKTKFRITLGSEDQPVDPLIASLETIERTPAYRGLALAIFEDLDLGEFGGRIPVLTFEVVADDGMTVAAMLADASGGLIEAQDDRPLPGYAAHGSSIGDGVASLVELCGVSLSEWRGKLRTAPAAAPVRIGSDELGCDAEGGSRAVERKRGGEKDMPSSLSLTYYDPARDYQTGQMHASSGRGGMRSEKIELPAVLSGEQARGLVEEALARTYRGGDRLRLRLPPSRMTLRPGDSILLDGGSAAWTIDSVLIDGLSVEVDAARAAVTVPTLPADSGRPVSEPDEPVGRTELLLFETPPASDALPDGPIACLAAATGGAWKPVPVEIRKGAEALGTFAVRKPSTIGHAVSLLPPGSAMVRDERSSVIVKLVGSGPLLNADDDALLGGANLALLGDELIQFGRAEEVAEGRFRLSRLLRGRRGTEWAMAAHAAGERFCLIASALLPIEPGTDALGTDIAAIAHGVGDAAPLPEAVRALTGEAMRPPSPCHLQLRRGGDAIVASWTRRSYRAWAWLDEVSAPDDPFAELYRVSIRGPLGIVDIENAQPGLLCPLADLPAAPGDDIEISVATVGPKALSRAISATFKL